VDLRRELRRIAEMPPGDYVRIEVTDTGTLFQTIDGAMEKLK